MENKFTPEQVRSAVRKLTKVQRECVRLGAISGDFTMNTVHALRGKGLFHLVISSPNGQCGFMHLTPFGEAVRAELAGAAR